jgi:hypothetical protein
MLLYFLICDTQLFIVFFTIVWMWSINGTPRAGAQPKLSQTSGVDEYRRIWMIKSQNGWMRACSLLLMDVPTSLDEQNMVDDITELMNRWRSWFPVPSMCVPHSRRPFPIHSPDEHGGRSWADVDGWIHGEQDVTKNLDGWIYDVARCLPRFPVPLGEAMVLGRGVIDLANSTLMCAIRLPHTN